MNMTPIPVKLAVTGVLLFVPLFLLSEAVPRLVYGLRIEPVYRLVQATISGNPVPWETARAAAEKFRDAPYGDGNDLTQAAEFLSKSSRGNSTVLLQSRSLLLDALSHTPTNPRAWTLFCQIEALTQPADAVRCLDKGFYISRYDWFTISQNMRLVALEWPWLDEPLRNEAVELVIPMWETTEWMWTTPQWIDGTTLRYALYDLSGSDNGRQLLLAGFLSDPEALRSFNRFVIRGRRSGH